MAEEQEPLFMAVRRDDPRRALAHARAAETMPRFRQLVEDSSGAYCSAKLRFRDPDGSTEGDEDELFYLWLCAVHFHPDEQIFSGAFFEVPKGFEKYHPVGSRLGFDAEDVFDWMVNDHGTIRGGYTLRASRASLAAARRRSFDRRLGAFRYEADDFDAALSNAVAVTVPTPRPRTRR